MIDKNRDGKDDRAEIVIPSTPAKDTKPVQPATKTIIVRETPQNIPHTDGYSAGNPSGAEHPGKNRGLPVGPFPVGAVAPVVAPAKVVIDTKEVEKVAADRTAENLADAQRRNELDYARRTLDGTLVTAVDGRLAARGDTSESGLAQIEAIDRESALLNRKRQDDKAKNDDDKAK